LGSNHGIGILPKKAKIKLEWDYSPKGWDYSPKRSGITPQKAKIKLEWDYSPKGKIETAVGSLQFKFCLFGE
jgi:hypothetical protein